MIQHSRFSNYRSFQVMYTAPIRLGVAVSTLTGVWVFYKKGGGTKLLRYTMKGSSVRQVFWRLRDGYANGRIQIACLRPHENPRC
ncbi:uncharacterized protein K460DRAFT_366788 [Cucurbitaria berberidis CBS 394.84]|uniref:Uncharacterized protein n=1 Tax=Cucurbitaria berberidis CBS 394.84 TaxID=1168544 RepID=A0A9P4GGZ6_9PLEO|nr:uncharacterized protein K460DRAFT_366788 [Cucurbitaria berberidis CBS 394.84]KAF1845943.1 hypothetical protein K460DRAFT_366788 [Cucurbitaria berberidis CBS 394.84]